jgi:hypothetical protein
MRICQGRGGEGGTMVSLGEKLQMALEFDLNSLEIFRQERSSSEILPRMRGGCRSTESLGTKIQSSQSSHRESSLVDGTLAVEEEQSGVIDESLSSVRSGGGGGEGSLEEPV